MFQSPLTFINNKHDLVNIFNKKKDFFADLFIATTNEIIAILDQEEEINFKEENGNNPDNFNFNKEERKKSFPIIWKKAFLFGIRSTPILRECYLGNSMGGFFMMDLHKNFDLGAAIFLLWKICILTKVKDINTQFAYIFDIREKFFFSIGLRTILNILLKIDITPKSSNNDVNFNPMLNNNKKKKYFRMILIGCNIEWYPSFSYNLLEAMKKSEIRISISSLLYKKVVLGLFNFNPHWKKNLLLIPIMLF